jgi:putative hydrolase of the HAD superfamily
MKLLVWDFHGTLGYREGRFSGACAEVLRAEAPNFAYSPAQLSAALQTGFPWHTPEIAHPQLANADAWWRALEPTFTRAFLATGLDVVRTTRFAPLVRARYCSPESWSLFPDSVETLTRLAAAGWTHVLLSNHVPELPDILNHLGLRDFFLRIVNSATIGYEKPHPQAFAAALEGLAGIESFWMIGDSLANDFHGALAIGWRAILVRQPATVSPAFKTLIDVADFLVATTDQNH